MDQKKGNPGAAASAGAQEDVAWRSIPHVSAAADRVNLCPVIVRLSCEKPRAIIQAMRLVEERNDVYRSVDGKCLVRLDDNGGRYVPVTRNWLLTYLEQHIRFFDDWGYPTDCPQWLAREIIANKAELNISSVHNLRPPRRTPAKLEGAS